MRARMTNTESSFRRLDRGYDSCVRDCHLRWRSWVDFDQAEVSPIASIVIASGILRL
jgi:hypothetical protein